MAFTPTLPPSVIIRLAKAEEAEGGCPDDDTAKKGNRREDWRKMKELEEARKAGTAPAMKDEDGKDINPHIPQYIMQAPWYYNTINATLRHQKLQPEAECKKPYTQMTEWYRKGVKQTVTATKYRKGACENCGAMTHKKKDCLERPRKIGARFTGADIAPDEHEQPIIELNYAGKRDLWNGYDLQDHAKVIEDFRQLEEAKRQLKGQKLESDMRDGDGEDTGRPEGAEDDEDKYADEMDMPGQKFETKQRITVRNLRIREDTAKYLFNLNLDSAHYDPKTRSMRDNPFVETGVNANELPYAGDNFVRASGDAHSMASQQVFAWQAYEKGADVHLQADPTRLAVLRSEYTKKKEEQKTGERRGIVERYGGEQHLEAPVRELLMAQTEDYVEYSRHGSVIKGQEKAKVKSRYEEDVYVNNHTSVWGSHWKDGVWGYKCCHQVVKESYCTGEAGIEASESAVRDLEEECRVKEAAAVTALEDENKPKTLVQLHQKKMADDKEAAKKAKKAKRREKKKKRKKKKKHRKKRSTSSSESSSSEEEEEAEEEDPEVKREREIQEAMSAEARRVRAVDRMMAMDERKRPYNCMFEVHEPTEVEMEAFRRKRARAEDPLARLWQS